MEPVPGFAGSLRWQVTDEGSVARVLAIIGESPVAETRVTFDGHAQRHLTAVVQGSVDESSRGRGLGTAMLHWAEALVRGRHRGPATLRIDLDRPDPRAAELFSANGFALAVSEDQMAREVAAPTTAALPPHVSLHAWSSETAPEFFRVYELAFRERPGFPGWDEAQWRTAFTSGPGFRQDLSLLLRSGREPIAYAVCDVPDATTGCILQMGISPAWRGRGVADRLLGAVLGRFHCEGLSTALLSVNVNNPRARNAYERAGFRKVGQYQSYRKNLS